VDLSGRPKNLYGVMRKMREKQKGLDQVYDVRALRVVVKSKTDCYAVLNQVRECCPITPRLCFIQVRWRATVSFASEFKRM